MMEVYLYGEESFALGDRVYCKTNRTISHFEKEANLSVPALIQKLNSGQLGDEQNAQPNVVGRAGHC